MESLTALSLCTEEISFDTRQCIHNISLYNLMEFITRVVGRGSAENLIRLVMVSDNPRITYMSKKLECAAHLLFPVHCFIEENNLEGDVAQSQFTILMKLLDDVYYPMYQSPRENLDILRDLAIHFYATINKMDLNSSEMETLLLESLCPWQVYRIMVDMELLSTTYPHSVAPHSVAGLYSESGERLVAATVPRTGKHFNHPFVDSMVYYHLYYMLKCSDADLSDDEEAVDEEVIVGLREAMRCTVPMRGGEKTKRGGDADIFLQVGSSLMDITKPVEVMCPYCDEDPCNVYAPACQHFVSCFDCRDDLYNKKCHICDTPWNASDVFLLVFSDHCTSLNNNLPNGNVPNSNVPNSNMPDTVLEKGTDETAV